MASHLQSVRQLQATQQTLARAKSTLATDPPAAISEFEPEGQLARLKSVLRELEAENTRYDLRKRGMQLALDVIAEYDAQLAQANESQSDHSRSIYKSLVKYKDISARYNIAADENESLRAQLKAQQGSAEAARRRAALAEKQQQGASDAYVSGFGAIARRMREFSDQVSAKLDGLEQRLERSTARCGKVLPILQDAMRPDSADSGEFSVRKLRAKGLPEDFRSTLPDDLAESTIVLVLMDKLKEVEAQCAAKEAGVDEFMRKRTLQTNALQKQVEELTAQLEWYQRRENLAEWRKLA